MVSARSGGLRGPWNGCAGPARIASQSTFSNIVNRWNGRGIWKVGRCRDDDPVRREPESSVGELDRTPDGNSVPEGMLKIVLLPNRSDRSGQNLA